MISISLPIVISIMAILFSLVAIGLAIENERIHRRIRAQQQRTREIQDRIDDWGLTENLGHDDP